MAPWAGGTVRIAAGAEVAVSGQLSVGGPGARLVNAGTLALTGDATFAVATSAVCWLGYAMAMVRLYQVGMGLHRDTPWSKNKNKPMIISLLACFLYALAAGTLSAAA